jgi:hypothetical protein
LTQTQGSTGDGTFSLLANAPGTSLATQAAIVAGQEIGLVAGYPVSKFHSQIGVMQTVNVLRFNSLSINYILPARVLRFFRVPSMTIALQGSNLGLHTNYRGADPNVNAFSTAQFGDRTLDAGQIPQPRTLDLTIRFGN